MSNTPTRLKEFIEEALKESPLGALGAVQKAMELESIERWFQTMYGIEFDIYIHGVPPKEGRYFGMSALEALKKEKN